MSADAQPQLEQQQPQQQAAQEQQQPQQQQQQQQEPEQKATEEASAAQEQQQPPKEKKPNPLKNILKTLFGCLRKPKVTDDEEQHAAGAEKEAKKALVSDKDGQANGGHDDANENANVNAAAAAAAAPATAGGEEEKTQQQAVPDHLGGATTAGDGKGVTTTISAN